MLPRWSLCRLSRQGTKRVPATFLEQSGHVRKRSGTPVMSGAFHGKFQPGARRKSALAALHEHPMVGFTRPPCDAGVIEATRAFDAALSQRRKWLTLVATIIGSSMAFLDGSVVNIALPAIQHALQADAAATQWIVNAYLLLLGALVLIGGSAADLYGRRRVFVLGVAVFIAASIACGLSPNNVVLVVSRAVQGFGAALL